MYQDLWQEPFPYIDLKKWVEDAVTQTWKDTMWRESLGRSSGLRPRAEPAHSDPAENRCSGEWEMNLQIYFVPCLWSAAGGPHWTNQLETQGQGAMDSPYWSASRSLSMVEKGRTNREDKVPRTWVGVIVTLWSCPNLCSEHLVHGLC